MDAVGGAAIKPDAESEVEGDEWRSIPLIVVWSVETQLRAHIVGDSSPVLSACLGGSQGYSSLTGSSQREARKVQLPNTSVL